MSRPLRASIPTVVLAAALVVGVAVIASGCSYVDPPVLAMSTTTSDAPYYTLSREELYKGLNEESTNTSTTVNAYDTKDTAAYINRKANLEFLKHFMAEKHIDVTAADRTRAQQEASSSSGSSGATPDQASLDLQAQLIAVKRSLANDAYASGQVDKEQKLREFYEANKSRIESPAQVCLHVIALQAGSGTAAPTEADFATTLAKATEIRRQLDTQSFESVADAQSQSSQAAPGGDQGCIPVSELGDVQAQVEALPDGTISQPLRTERGGYYIIRMDRHQAASLPTLDQVRNEVEAEVSQSIGQSLLAAVVGEAFRRTEVTVDPRFGSWDPSKLTVTQPPAAAEPTMPTTTSPAGLGLDPTGRGAVGSSNTP